MRAFFAFASLLVVAGCSSPPESIAADSPELGSLEQACHHPGKPPPPPPPQRNPLIGTPCTGISTCGWIAYDGTPMLCANRPNTVACNQCAYCEGGVVISVEYTDTNVDSCDKSCSSFGFGTKASVATASRR